MGQAVAKPFIQPSACILDPACQGRCNFPEEEINVSELMQFAQS